MGKAHLERTHSGARSPTHSHTLREKRKCVRDSEREGWRGRGRREKERGREGERERERERERGRNERPFERKEWAGGEEGSVSVALEAD